MIRTVLREAFAGLVAARADRVQAAAPEEAGEKVRGERVRWQLFMAAVFLMLQSDTGIMKD